MSRNFENKVGRILQEFSTNKTITMPALGAILALRDIEKTRTIKTILNLPSKQLEIIKTLSDSFAPDLALNLNTTSTSDSSKTANQVGSYLSQERRSGN